MSPVCDAVCSPPMEPPTSTPTSSPAPSPTIAPAPSCPDLLKNASPTHAHPQPKQHQQLQAAAGLRRNHSLGSLLHSFGHDHHFLDEFDDDKCSVVSVDSVRSEAASSTVSDCVLGRQLSAPAAVAGADATGLPKKIDALAIAEKQRTKLSQAMIWTWLTSSKAVPEDGTAPAAAAAAAAPAPPPPAFPLGASDLPGASKVDIQHLRKLKYRKYYRDLNVTSPSNW